MGGGGFTMEPDNPALDDFILSLVSTREPRVLFLPTASGDPAAQIGAFHERFRDRACRPDVLSLFRLSGSVRTLREVVLEQDVLYIGGGSMRNLLAIWRAHELDALLVEAWERGVVLAGLSAGAMCWFEGGVTRSSGPPEPIAGLGLLPGSLTVHADGEPERLPAWLEAVPTGALPRGRRAGAAAGLARGGPRGGAARGVGGRRRGRPALPRPDARARRRLPPGRGRGALRLGRRRAGAAADRARAARRGGDGTPPAVRRRARAAPPRADAPRAGRERPARRPLDRGAGRLSRVSYTRPPCHARSCSPSCSASSPPRSPPAGATRSPPRAPRPTPARPRPPT